MKKFKRTRKIVALLLSLSLITGMMPASALSAFAADENAVVDYAVIMSDLHTTKSDNKASTVKGVLNAMKNDGKNATTVNSAGDMFSVNETNYDCNTSAITNAIKEVYGSADINYVWTDHDRTSDISKESGLVYGTGEDEEYYVYLLSMADLSSWDRYGAGFYSASEISNHIEAFRTTVAGLDKTKPLFIVGHQPLFNDRGDNGYAYQWVTAINEIATTMDVAYFNGHNHNYDEAANYYYEKGTTVDVPTTKVLSGSGYSTKLETKAVEFKFTHINAGYLSPATGNTSNTRMGTALAVTIYEDSINYTTYNSKGVYTGNFKVNETVERDYAEEASNTVTDLDGMVSVTATSPGLAGITATNVVAEKNLESYFADYVAYEVELEGYQEGEDVRYSMYLLEDMDATNLELYLVGENNELTPIAFKIVTDEQGNQYLEFTVKGDGCFAYGAPNVPEGYELSKIEVSNVVKTVYYQGESLDMVNPVVTATYTKDGAQDFERILYIVSEGYEDGYTISGYDMTQVGKQTVTIAYGDKTTSFDITVKQKGAVDDKYGIRVEDAEDNITSLAVERTVKTVEGYEAYVLYDIVPEGYVHGTEATVTIPVDDTIFDVTRPVKVIDIERDTVQNAYIEEGKVTFATNHFSEYAVAQVAEGTATTVNGVVATSVSNSSTTTVDNNSYYLIKNNRNNLFLTGDKVTNSNMLVLDGTANRPTLAANNIWYVNNVSGSNYRVQYKSPEGKYLTIGNGTAALTDTATNVAIAYNNNQGIRAFDIAVGNYHLNNYSDGEQAAGYTRGAANDAGSRWSLYKVTTAPVTLSVADSDLSMFVGDKHNLTPVVTVNNNTVSDSTITWESSNEDVVSFNDAGQVVAVGAGTAEITAILASVDNGRLLAPVRITIPVQVGVFVEGTTIDITHKTTQQIVDRTLVVKNVEENNSTYEFDYKVFVDGRQLETKPVNNITWSSSDEGIATVENGTVTFHGEEGVVRITVSYEYENDTHATDTVLISVSKGNYMLPSDGTNDFPEYPNEGSIRFDKTATAVGNFSETGIAQLELSMTGVPSSSASRMDVVLMLDRSSSMAKDNVKDIRIPSTIAATKAFIKNIVINEDGSFNNNRIRVMDFLGGNLAQGNQHQYKSNLYTKNDEAGYEIISNQAELDALFDRIDDEKNGFVAQTTLYGTEYARSLEDCYNALHASQPDGNKQFCVFMSDGIPNYMMGEKTHFESTNAITGTFDVTNRNSANGTASRNATKYEYEYYSTKMKNEGVTVFTVGLGLKNTNSAWSNTSKEVCEQVANMLLNDISGPAGEKVTDRDTGNAVSKLDEYFFSVADDNAAAHMEDVFKNIAKKILEAAKNVKVTDKIADEYTMIFDIPEGPEQGFIEEHLPKGQEFYIEFLNYSLKPVVEQGVTTDYIRDKETSLMKLYLAKDKDGNYYAASNAAGATFATPVFEAVQEGQDGYYNLVNGTYVFTANGTGTHNMISGARVSGTTNDNLVIETPYVHYEAANRILVWTADKLSSSELALRYFLYLNKSAAEKPENQVDAGTYPTNDYATLEYTNFQGNDCQQIFPKPQMTWNGAQVSYVFYLVNEDGKPVNRAGRVVPFSEAVYVTDIFSHAVTWNKNDASAKLEEQYLAKDKLPDVYKLYDEHAGYNIYVYETENGKDKNNHFDIIGSSKEANTTYVFNTKSDNDKYRNPGTYTADGKNNTNKVHPGFDFSNTTVAFAVLWEPKLAEDTVVIDYGLPVDIDVARNDAVAGSVTGLFDANNAAMLQDVKINEGQISNRVQFATALNSGQVNGIKYGRAEVLNNTTVRYTPVDMKMSTPDKFYYVSTLNYYAKDKNGNVVLEDSRMYSSVTVIPATTVYYEDEFIDFTVLNSDGTVKYKVDETGNVTDEPEIWDTEGTTKSATQAQDRPGKSQISANLDADNLYGYDDAYSDCSLYSLGSARKIDVTSDVRGEATFSFYGTGFDIVGLTSNTTGTLIVQVTDANGKNVKTSVVDTYYGYAYVDGEWVTVDSNSPNALYQIPVMKISDLTYGKYTVKLIAGYNQYFDHTTDANGNYTLYIDAVRIYDPASPEYVVDDKGTDGTDDDVSIADIYKLDGEAYPEYSELRDKILKADTFVKNADRFIIYKEVDINQFEDGVTYYVKSDNGYVKVEGNYNRELTYYVESTSVSGIVFIDGALTDPDGDVSIADYTSYGPNNEVYLQPGQAIAFELNATAASGELSKVQLAVKTVGRTGTVEVYGVDAAGNKTECLNKTIRTATDMYYDITALNGKTVVIKNSGDANTVSITNVKTTYTAEQPTPQATMFMVSRASVENAITTLTAPVVPDTPVVPEEPDTPVVPDTPVTPEQPDTPAVPDKPEVDEPEVDKPVVDEPEAEKPAADPAKIVSVKTDKKTYTQGDKVKVTVTTNKAATKVKVGTKTLKTFKTKNGKKSWTTTVKASKIGKLSISAVAYNKEGTATKKVTKKVTVQQFAPKKFNVTLSKSKVKKGAKYTVTVKTSTDVKYVKVNGKKITKFTTDKKKTTRTFKITYKATKVGKKTVKVISYNKAGYASKAKSKTVTVKRK